MSAPAVVELMPVVTDDMARELAIAQRVCVRPIIRRVEDRQTGTTDIVAIPCGSTRDSVCPSCAHKAKVLRMQQCAEGWHRDHEPDQDHPTDQLDDQVLDDDQLDQMAGDSDA